MSTIEYLDPEIANEGLPAHVLPEGTWTPDGEFQPFMQKPRIPTYDFVEVGGQNGKKHALLKYFPQYSGVPYQFQAFPCWAYNTKTGETRLLRTEQHATEHGMQFVKKTRTFNCTGDWSDEPPEVAKFDPSKPGAGKTVRADTSPTSQADTIAAVVAAVMTQIAPKAAAPNALAAPVAGDADFAEFQAFKAWKASQKAAPAAPEPVKVTAADQKAALVKVATEAGIKVKSEWGLDEIKAQLDRVGTKAKK